MTSPASRLRTRRGALLLGVLGAGLTLATMSLTWGHVGGGGAAERAVLTGREAAPAAFALSLAALAGLAVLLLVGGTGRRLVGALLMALGAGTVVAAVGAALDLAERTRAGATGPTLVVPDGAAQVVLSPWLAWTAAFGGVLVLAAGALALVGGPGWPAPSSRYGSAGAGRPPDPWRALDEGVDPTVDD